jgi:hypothetical protein
MSLAPAEYIIIGIVAVVAVVFMARLLRRHL